jgi:hypothetical protein
MVAVGWLKEEGEEGGRMGVAEATIRGNAGPRRLVQYDTWHVHKSENPPLRQSQIVIRNINPCENDKIQRIPMLPLTAGSKLTNASAWMPTRGWLTSTV